MALFGSSSKSSTTYNIDESTHLLDQSVQSSQATQQGDNGLSAIASDVRVANSTSVVSNVLDAGAIEAASDAQARSIAAQLDLGRAAISGIADTAGSLAGGALDRVADVVSDAFSFGREAQASGQDLVGGAISGATDTVRDALGKVADVVSGALEFGRDALDKALTSAADTSSGALALAADAKAPDAQNVRAQVYAMAGVAAAALVAVMFFGRGKR